MADAEQAEKDAFNQYTLIVSAMSDTLVKSTLMKSDAVGIFTKAFRAAYSTPIRRRIQYERLFAKDIWYELLDINRLLEDKITRGIMWWGSINLTEKINVVGTAIGCTMRVLEDTLDIDDIAPFFDQFITEYTKIKNNLGTNVDTTPIKRTVQRIKQKAKNEYHRRLFTELLSIF